MTEPLYPGSQADFVVLVDTILNSMQEYLLQFTNLRPKYIQAWIDDRRAELLAAEALPDRAARQAVSSLIYVDLVAQNKVCCALWQALKSSIKGAYPASTASIHLNSAGQGKYEDAAAGKWTETKAMLVSAKNFITANLAALTANGNMAASFATTFSDAAALFNTILSNYESSLEAIPVGTDKRVEAFNELYRGYISPMSQDGQQIFRENEPVRTQFVIAHIMDRISGPGLAGARGMVINDTDSYPIEGALVEIWLPDTPTTRYFAITDSEGKYRINCPSGDYKIKFTANGYMPSAEKNISIAIGTVSNFSEKLSPVAPDAE